MPAQEVSLLGYGHTSKLRHFFSRDSGRFLPGVALAHRSHRRGPRETLRVSLLAGLPPSHGDEATRAPALEHPRWMSEEVPHRRFYSQAEISTGPRAVRSRALSASCTVPLWKSVGVASS